MPTVPFRGARARAPAPRPNLSCSVNGRAAIEAREGERLTAYKDVVGIWTIGTGHTSAAGPPRVVPGMAISRGDADAILSIDLKPIEATINRNVVQKLQSWEFDALCSFILNVGGGAFKSSTVLRQINLGHMEAAGNAMLAWNKAGGRVIPGLVQRRSAERAQFLGVKAPMHAAIAPEQMAHAVDNPDPFTTRAANRAALALAH